MIKVFEKGINETNVLYWLDLFKKGRQKELISLNAFYHGKDPIGKAVTGSNRINNNVHVNLASMIIKNATDYFIGEPVAYSYSEGFKAQEYVDELQFKNIEDAENKEVAIDSGKFGLGYELVNIKEDKTLFYKRLDPLTTFDIYGVGLVPERLCCISYISYKPRNMSEITEGFIYSKEEIIAFTLQHRRVTFGERTPNVFGKIPIVYYQNNADRMGDYERVTDLLTAYNKLMSCAVDDYESISNAILLIRDSKKIDDATKESLNSTRVIQLFSENAEMAFINKTLDSTFVKTIREALREDILTITNVPDFTDDKFAGNSSGVSLQYKLIGFENLRADKEIYFKQALARRWEIISLYPAKSFELKRDDIKIDMYPNLPSNVELDNEIADLYNKGVISRKTMLEKLQMVKDADEEEKRLDEEETTRMEKIKDELTNNDLPKPKTKPDLKV